MKKVVITGANGFLGSALTRELVKSGVEVIALVYGSQTNNIPQGVRVIQFDLADCDKLPDIIQDRDIDVIFHMAWDGNSGPSRADYARQLKNAERTCDIVCAAAKCGIKRFVGAGSLAQFDCASYIEKDFSTPNAVSCYGTAKIAAQYMSKAIANVSGIEHVWCVISNIYGVGNTTMNFVNMAVKKMLNGERASFTSGTQNYDFVYVDDVINGIILCGEKGKNNCSYYIGSGKPRALREYIYEIRDAVDPNISLYLGEIPFNGTSLPIEKYSCENIRKDTGYCASVDFSTGIKETVAWIRGLKNDSKI